MAAPLPIKQPIPDTVTAQDVLVEAALQARTSMVEMTTHVPRARASRAVTLGRTAFTVVAHDAMGYSFRQIATILRRPLSSTMYGYYETAPRLRLKNARYRRIEAHLNLFARGLPTTRLDLVNRGRAGPNVVTGVLEPGRVAPQERILRLWVHHVADADGTIHLNNLDVPATACGLSRQGVSRLLARFLDQDVIAIARQGQRNVVYSLSEGVPSDAIVTREASMSRLWEVWLTHRHTPGVAPSDYPYIHAADISSVDEAATFDPQRWSPQAVAVKGLGANLEWQLEEYAAPPLTPPYRDNTTFDLTGFRQMEKLTKYMWGPWNEMAGQRGLQRMDVKSQADPTLQRKARARMRDLRGMMNWRLYMRRIAQSDYLCGANPFGFRATLRWALDRRNLVAVISGVYDNDNVVRLRARERREVERLNEHLRVYGESRI